MKTITQDTLQQRSAIQNRLDDTGTAVWSSVEVWDKLWKGFLPTIEAYHQNDQDHRFDLTELAKAAKLIQANANYVQSWIDDVERIQAQ
jgi:hypothetical protein